MLNRAHIHVSNAATRRTLHPYSPRPASLQVNSSMSANTPEEEDGEPPSSPDDLTFWSISPAPIGEDRSSAQHCADQSSEYSVAEDPFGFRGTTAFGDAVERMERDIDRRRKARNYSFPCAACPQRLVVVFRGVAHALSATPKVIGWNADGVADAQADNNNDDYDHDKDDDDEEEPGSLRAAGMTKSWTRTELVFCYTLCVCLASCSSQLTRPALNLIQPTPPLTTSTDKRQLGSTQQPPPPLRRAQSLCCPECPR